MKRFKVPAIVFGGGINGLAVVRNLGRSGVTVYCVVDEKDEVRYSRFCKKYFIVPHIQESVSVLSNFLEEVERDLDDHAVIFPSSDSYTLHLSLLKEELENNYYIPLASYKVVETLVNKAEFCKSLSKNSVPHPATYIPESPEDVKRMGKDVKYPLFVKPSMSQEFSRKFRAKGFTASSEEELMKYYLLAASHNIDVIFQEVIPGLSAKNVYGIEGYFDKQHNLKASFAYCRLRGWPPVFGNTSLRESIPISELMSQYVVTRDYLHDIKYHGMMEAEWKKDPRDGVFKLLEINARQSMQNSLPTRCGVNLVMLAYLDAIGARTCHTNYYETGVKWIDFPNDLRSAIKTKTSARDWICSLRRVREWSAFAVDDVHPWISRSLDTLKTIARARLGGWKNVVEKDY